MLNICALDAGFSQVVKNCQVFCQIIRGVFLTFLLKIKDVNSICQTTRDALRPPPLRVPPAMVTGATLAMVLVCAISGQPVGALVDVVGG